MSTSYGEGWDLPPLVPQGKLVCVSEERWADLERDREADHAAIRALSDEAVVMLELDARGYAMPTAKLHALLIEHESAIQRATEARG